MAEDEQQNGQTQAGERGRIPEVRYHTIQSESRDDIERRLNKAFDILFEFTMKARDKGRSNPRRPCLTTRHSLEYRFRMEFQTREEVARYLRVHVRTVERWLRSGSLKGYKLGSGRTAVWRIPKGEVEKFLQRNANFRKNE